MHGGVSQFKDKKQPVEATPEELLEGNAAFIKTVNTNGYDLILPIAFNQYNWLEPGGEQFINNIIDKYCDEYERVYISGFSDGGTGAYRFFYNRPDIYSGVIIFNGYPQLNNYYKKVDHFKATGKQIIFCSTLSDNVIPYEFLMVEFRRQQMINKQTYFLLRDGEHDFKAYKQQHFDLCMQLLAKKKNSKTPAAGKMFVYPPIDGYITDGTLKEIFSFRKRIGKAYNMAQEEHSRSDYSYKDFGKMLSKNDTILLQAIEVSKEQAKSVKSFDFDITVNGKEQTIKLNNWLSRPTW